MRARDLARNLDELRAANKRLRRLYVATNALMVHMGCHGYVSTRSDLADEVMAALHAIDDGTPIGITTEDNTHGN